MPATINPMITDAGLAAAIDADENEIQLAITHISLGTGQYDAQAVGAGMTAMAARKETVPLGGGVVSGTGAMKMTVRFETWTGTPNPYDATELGFWAGNPDSGGILFAVHSHPSEVLVQRNALDYVASFILQLTRVPPGSITVTIDPSQVAALALVVDHEEKPDPHTQYVKKVGDISVGPQLGLQAPQHDNTKKFSTTDWVNRVGVNYPRNGGMAVVGASAAIAVADIGRFCDIQFNGAQVTLPPTADVPIGGSISFVVSAQSAALLPSGADTFAYPGGSSVVFPVVFGESLTLTRNETGIWRVTSSGFRMPAGIVSYFAGNVAPPGWLKLNGVLLSRSAYPALWAYAQSTGVVSEADWTGNGMSGRFSSGTSGSDFRIPDLRGLFLRAHDDGRGIDAGRVFGSFQDHANRSHGHGLTDPGHGHTLTDPGHGHGMSDPGHIHSAWTDVQGQHSHTYQYKDTTPLTISPGAPNFLMQGPVNLATSAAGAHGHNVGIGGAATGISIAPAGSNLSVQNRVTGMSVQADGSEARPKNIAFGLFIRF